MSLAEAQKILTSSTMQSFKLPGEPGFPLNGMFPTPKDSKEAEQVKSYLAGLRTEAAARLLQRVYSQDPSKPNPFWMTFQKRKFMNKSL